MLARLATHAGARTQHLSDHNAWAFRGAQRRPRARRGPEPCQIGRHHHSPSHYTRARQEPRGARTTTEPCRAGHPRDRSVELAESSSLARLHDTARAAPPQRSCVHAHGGTWCACTQQAAGVRARTSRIDRRAGDCMCSWASSARAGSAILLRHYTSVLSACSLSSCGLHSRPGPTRARPPTHQSCRLARSRPKQTSGKRLLLPCLGARSA